MDTETGNWRLSTLAGEELGCAEFDWDDPEGELGGDFAWNVLMQDDGRRLVSRDGQPVRETVRQTALPLEGE